MKKFILFIIVLIVLGCKKESSSPGEVPLDTINDIENETQDCVDTWDGSACSMPENNIHIKANGSVLYNISTDISGFQFTVDGATVLGTSGGAAEDANFSVTTGNNIVIGFSFNGTTIPAGCGELVNLSLNQSPSMLSQIIFSNENGESISIEYFFGEFSRVDMGFSE